MSFQPGPLLGAPLTFPQPVSGGGGCPNTVVVDSADPLATLPTPVGGQILLAGNTEYRFCGQVALADTVVPTATTVISGADPMLDGIVSSAQIAIQAIEGGTIRDLFVVARPGDGTAILVGATAPGTAVDLCALWNLALSGGVSGVFVGGPVSRLSVARVVAQTENPFAVKGAFMDALAITDSVFEVSAGAPALANSVAIDSSSQIASFAMASVFCTTSAATQFGLKSQGLVGVARITGCAWDGPAGGAASEIAQPAGFPSPVTLAASSFFESVGCVGFENTATRAGISASNLNTDFSATAPGSFVAIGLGDPAAFTLSSNAARFDLDGGPAAENQGLRYRAESPIAIVVEVSLSLQLDLPGPSFAPRVLAARLTLNGAPVGDDFAGTTPDITFAAPTTLTFSRTLTVTSNDILGIELTNETDQTSVIGLSVGLTATA